MSGQMADRRQLEWLYLLNASVLITHEIDSAYWREWDLFGLPGGLQFFLVFNLALVVVVLYGLAAIARSSRGALVFSWLLVGGGVVASVVHGCFLASGSRAFRQPISLALLAAALLLSSLQAVVTARDGRAP